MDPIKAGLMLDHSYTVLDAKESNKLGVRLLEIRNPWGHGEWNGDWSDFSPLWTQTAKQEFGITEDLDPDDGAFWMCWQDFLNYFTTLTVCYCLRAARRNGLASSNKICASRARRKSTRI